MNNINNIELILEIDNILSPILDSNNFFNKEISREITEGLDQIIEILGIPGKSKVMIKELKKEKVLPNRFIRVILNGHQCRYPDYLLLLVLNYLNCHCNDVPCEIETDLKNILGLLKKMLDDPIDIANNNGRNFIEFFSLSCLEIVKYQPGIILGAPQFDTYLNSIPLVKGNEKVEILSQDT